MKVLSWEQSLGVRRFYLQTQKISAGKKSDSGQVIFLLLTVAFLCLLVFYVFQCCGIDLPRGMVAVCPVSNGEINSPLSELEISREGRCIGMGRYKSLNS